MAGDTPAILDKAIEQDLWVYFDNGADAAEATDDAAATDAEQQLQQLIFRQKHSSSQTKTMTSTQ